MGSKIISFIEKKKLKELKAKEVKFKSYLSSLKQDQLQTEANYIINKIKDENLSDEFLLRSALLMDELAIRVDTVNISHTIQKFSKNLRSKMKVNLQTI